MKERELSDDKNICKMASQMWKTPIFQSGAFEEAELSSAAAPLDACAVIRPRSSILLVGCFGTGVGLCWLMLNISNILSQQSFALFV